MYITKEDIMKVYIKEIKNIEKQLNVLYELVDSGLVDNETFLSVCVNNGLTNNDIINMINLEVLTISKDELIEMIDSLRK
jgi:hypothetical protein